MRNICTVGRTCTWFCFMLDAVAQWSTGSTRYNSFKQENCNALYTQAFCGSAIVLIVTARHITLRSCMFIYTSLSNSTVALTCVYDYDPRIPMLSIVGAIIGSTQHTLVDATP